MTAKALIVPDLAFTPHKTKAGDSGYSKLKAKLKYFQFRNDRDGHIPQEEGRERWVDKGLGQNYRDILNTCNDLSSHRLLAWTWVVSPAPDLMALVPEAQREELVKNLTEEIVEAYYSERGVDIPEYSYVIHDRLTKPGEDGSPGLQQLHTHVVLPATVPTVDGSREAFDNRANKGHFNTLREISTIKFEAALEHYVGPEWRTLRPDLEPTQPPIEQEFTQATALPPIHPDAISELDQWFGPRLEL